MFDDIFLSQVRSTGVSIRRKNAVLCTFAEAPTSVQGVGPTACGHADSQTLGRNVSCKACRPTNSKQGVAHHCSPQPLSNIKASSFHQGPNRMSPFATDAMVICFSSVKKQRRRIEIIILAAVFSMVCEGFALVKELAVNLGGVARSAGASPAPG